jgi:hypothetical protein
METEDERVRQIVRMTIHEVFDGVGVDMTTPEGRQKFRDNNQFVGEWREGSSALKKGGWIAVGGTFISGMAWLLWHGAESLPTVFKVMK